LGAGSGEYKLTSTVRVFNQARENGGRLVWEPLKKDFLKKFYVAKERK
jgi:hypothetical protein